MRRYVDGIRPPLDPNEVYGEIKQEETLGLALMIISGLGLLAIILELLEVI